MAAPIMVLGGQSVLWAECGGLCWCRNCKIANKSSFGAFVEILPGVKGMVHISEMDTGRSNLEDFPDGMQIDVKLLEVRQQNPMGLALSPQLCFKARVLLLG